MESCFGKSVMSGVMGFGMGGLFGIFMASVCYSPSAAASPSDFGLICANASPIDVLRYTIR